MSPSIPGKRVLRTGLVIGSDAHDEKLLKDEGERLSVGQSSANDFIAPVEKMPLTWDMFFVRGGQYYLRFSQYMSGKVSDSKNVYLLTDLRGQSKQEGGAYIFPLQDGMHGKIEVGAMKVLFQFINEPPPAPVPKLPIAVRGSLVERLDPLLTAILAISVLIHGAIVVAAMVRDYVPEKVGFTESVKEEILRPAEVAVAVQLPDDPLPEKKDPEADGGEKAKNSGGAKKPASNNDPKPSGGGNKGGSAEEAAAEVAAAIGALGFGEEGDGPGGASGRAPGADLGKQLESTAGQGSQLAVGTGSGDRTRTGSGGVGTGSGPNLGGAGGGVTSAGGRTNEKVPKSRVSIGNQSSLDDTNLSPSKVVADIKRKYMGGLKRCHSTALKKDPQAKGKVNLSFTVSESGRLSRYKANGFDATLTQCIESKMKTWRFTPPKDSDGDPTDASFKISLALQGS